MFLANEFRAQAVRRGKTLKDIAAHLGISDVTLYRKIRNGGSFTRAEIAKLISYLDIKNPDEIFFADRRPE